MLRQSDSCRNRPPENFWPELTATVVCLKNRSPTSTLVTTPYEALFRMKPDLSHLRSSGATTFVHIPKGKRKKLDSKFRKCIPVGYEGRNQYRLYDPIKGEVIISRDIVFMDEQPITSTLSIAPASITTSDHIHDNYNVSMAAPKSTTPKTVYDMIEVAPLPSTRTTTATERTENTQPEVREAQEQAEAAETMSDESDATTAAGPRTSERSNKGQPAEKYGEWQSKKAHSLKLSKLMSPNGNIFLESQNLITMR